LIDLGKYYHRYRKPREVVYTTDREYHLALKDPSSKKKREALLKAAGANLGVSVTPADGNSPANPETPLPTDEPTDERLNVDDDEDLPLQNRSRMVSSRSSSSEPLLAHSSVSQAPLSNATEAVIKTEETPTITTTAPGEDLTPPPPSAALKSPNAEGGVEVSATV
jgi:SWI/SNF-related matrix-associated actin-dependent regulator of chromatin subfamily B protein 1